MSAGHRNHPKAPHQVYRAYDSEGVLLYIGCTFDFRERLTVHANETHWAKHAATVTIAHYPNKADARAAEAEAIRTEQPLHNKVHHPHWRHRQAQELRDLVAEVQA